MNKAVSDELDKMIVLAQSDDCAGKAFFWIIEDETRLHRIFWPYLVVNTQFKVRRVDSISRTVQFFNEAFIRVVPMDKAVCICGQVMHGVFIDEMVVLKAAEAKRINKAMAYIQSHIVRGKPG